MEIQQSPIYKEFVKRIHWDAYTLDGSAVFLKHLPLVGTLVKIHRPARLPDPERLISFLNDHRAKRLAIEPDRTVSQQTFTTWYKNLPPWIKLNRSPFLPSKTIRIDLSPSIDRIFESFTEAKRRAVRRAVKAGVRVVESSDIETLIRVKNRSAGLLGFITTTGIRELWSVFAPSHAAILLAYAEKSPKPVAGVLLVFCDNTAYYWIAGASKEGKKKFAPTLLVYEALKLSKSRGAKQFDFVGVWDERLPKENISWKGFTKFKEGFGGNTVYYPLVV